MILSFLPPLLWLSARQGLFFAFVRRYGVIFFIFANFL